MRESPSPLSTAKDTIRDNLQTGECVQQIRELQAESSTRDPSGDGSKHPLTESAHFMGLYIEELLVPAPDAPVCLLALLDEGSSLLDTRFQAASGQKRFSGRLFYQGNKKEDPVFTHT